MNGGEVRWTWEVGKAFPLSSSHMALHLPSVSSVHPASTFPAIQGASLPALTTQPSPLVSGGFPPPEEETHSQPVNPHSLHHLHAAYRVGKKSLLHPTCSRVRGSSFVSCGSGTGVGEGEGQILPCASLCSLGMLALEMLGRRAHNDHPNNFSRSPPYTDDVKWLLGLAAKLGNTSLPRTIAPNLLPFPSRPRPPS